MQHTALKAGRRAMSWQRGLLALVLSVGLLLPSAAPAAAAAPGEIIVQPAAGVTIEQVNLKYRTVTLFKLTGTTQALVTSLTAEATLAAMAADPAYVTWAESNTTAKDPRAKDDAGSDPYQMQILSANNDDDRQAYRDQWGVARATLDKAHAISQGAGVTIAVLDTRIDQTHKELAGKTLARIDTVAIDPKINLPTSGVVKDHGTYVASVALRAAPQAKILPVRVLNEDGLSSLATVAEGIRRAADGGATVINMSLSTSSYSLVLEDAVAYAQRRGSVLVAAYGNEETNSTKVYPADFPGVLSVVATDEQDRRATFSNYSRAACVAAPGVKAVGAYTGDHFAIADGTSFAAPWVAGQAALLLAKGTAADRVGSQITLVSGK